MPTGLAQAHGRVPPRAQVRGRVLAGTGARPGARQGAGAQPGLPQGAGARPGSSCAQVHGLDPPGRRRAAGSSRAQVCLSLQGSCYLQ